MRARLQGRFALTPEVTGSRIDDEDEDDDEDDEEGLPLSGVMLSNNLRHFYRLDQANGATDVRDGYHGIVTGGAWVADSPPQDAGGWQKTASNQHIEIPMRVNLLVGTYEGWFKTGSSVGNWQDPLATSIRATNEAHPSDSMRIEVANNLTYIFDSPGAGTVVAAIDTTDDLWHHLALTYENGEHVMLYIDGILAGESSADYSALLAYDRGVTMIGSRLPNVTAGWRGTAGSLAYFDIALSADTILDHAQHGMAQTLPEPATLSLLLAGLAAAAWRRRRRGWPRRSSAIGPRRSTVRLLPLLQWRRRSGHRAVALPRQPCIDPLLPSGDATGLISQLRNSDIPAWTRSRQQPPGRPYCPAGAHRRQPALISQLRDSDIPAWTLCGQRPV